MMTKRIAIFGASGKIGRLLCNQLKQGGVYEPLAFMRRQELVEQFAQEGITAKVLSVEDNSPAAIAKELQNVFAVVFTAGAGGKGGADRTLQVDLDGAVKTMEACELAQVNRYIMVSAFKAEDREAWWDGPLRSYFIAKMHADRALKSTKLDYTILRPAALLEGEATGKITIPSKAEQADKANHKIQRADVATSVVACLNDASTIKKVIPLIQGDADISEAISK